MSIGYASMGAMEARICLVGSVLIVGIPFEAAGGNTLKEKRSNLVTCTAENLSDMAEKSKGFVIAAKPGELTVTPSGFLLVHVYEESINAGLRWTLCADAADALRVKTALHAMLTSFPELKAPSTGCQTFVEHLCREA